MKKKKLIPMIQFVSEKNETTFDYRDFHNDVVEYAKFLNMDLREDMFIGENPIFPDFIKCTPKQAEQLGIKKSFDNFGENEFMMRLFQKNYKAGGKTYNTWVTHFHLKKVEQLVTFGILYNER